MAEADLYWEKSETQNLKSKFKSPILPSENILDAPGLPDGAGLPFKNKLKKVNC